MSTYAAQRLNMVETQVRPNDVTDARIHRAMSEIPRELFVSPHLRVVAYMEGCIDLGGGRVLLDARCFSKLAQLAEIAASDAVLDVGCGSGYSAAVLARLAATVVALEENEALAKLASERLGDCANVTPARGRLADGFPGRAPYDVIFVDGGVETRPLALLNQLATGGRLVCVMREVGQGHAHLFVKCETGFSERSAFDAQVPTLPGFKKIAGFVF